MSWSGGLYAGANGNSLYKWIRTHQRYHDFFAVHTADRGHLGQWMVPIGHFITGDQLAGRVDDQGSVRGGAERLGQQPGTRTRIGQLPARLRGDLKGLHKGLDKRLTLLLGRPLMFPPPGVEGWLDLHRRASCLLADETHVFRQLPTPGSCGRQADAIGEPGPVQRLKGAFDRLE